MDDLRIADFGTRRRHSFLWQDWCVQAMTEGLGEKFVGTSNCLIAMHRELEAIGTNAHELPMVYCALGNQWMRNSNMHLIKSWKIGKKIMKEILRIILPDTYGTFGFSKKCT